MMSLAKLIYDEYLEFRASYLIDHPTLFRDIEKIWDNLIFIFSKIISLIKQLMRYRIWRKNQNL